VEEIKGYIYNVQIERDSFRDETKEMTAAKILIGSQKEAL
jgi:hypothetical protein